MKKQIFSALIAMTLTTGSAMAAPAIMFDLGGKFDKSFNESAYNGAEAYKAETGNDYFGFELTNEGQRDQVMTRLVQRGNPVVFVGFMNQAPLDKMAGEYPDTNFVIIDSVVDKPNVRSVVFKEHEGSFLVGALAALKSETGSVGFIGGMDVPLIRRFACGYAQGAKHINDKINVIENMTGTTPAAWNNTTKGGLLARGQFEQGVDVVFAAAGGTGLGVYQAAADAGKFAIGVDSNQNHLHPGTMLSSMVKQVSVAVQTAFMDADGDDFQTGVQVLGLAEDGVSWALDEHNRDLVSAQMEETVNKLRDEIIAGDIAVHDYTSNMSCDM